MSSATTSPTYALELANNWTAYWNTQHNKYYYHNSSTNENTWLRPVDSALPSTTAKPNKPQLKPEEAEEAAVYRAKSIPATTNARTFVAPDGNVFEWSTETSSWELLQQSSSTDRSDKSTSSNNGQSRKRKRNNNKRKKSQNTTVYFSGVPKDTTITEVDNTFKRYGVIKAVGDGKMIKLYYDDDGNVKGDGTITYLMRPAMDNAIAILNGAQFRPGCVITVQEAAFSGPRSSSSSSSSFTAATTSAATATTATATTNAKSNNKRSAGKSMQSERQKKVQRLKEAQVLSWEEGESEHKGLKIVVLKHVFRPIDLNGSGAEQFERRLEQTIASRCEQCGPLDKLTLYASHIDGVMIARFGTSYGAEQCIAKMHGTHGLDTEKKMHVYYWDGEENFEKRRDHEEEERRVDAFGSWLEEGDPDEHLTELDRVVPKQRT